MGRRKRPHAPGMVFHLISRTHRGERWFTRGLRTQIAGLIQRTAERSDAQLLAYAVMPNHLHLVVRQGRSELAAVMQPLLRRVAHRVQRYHGFEGSVVERRFRDRMCNTAGHVREAILYTHLNPLRAGLCNADLAYPWTTQRAYLPGSDPAPFGIDPHVQQMVLELFADEPSRSRDQLCGNYLRWLECRIHQDESRKASAEDRPDDEPPSQPVATMGDMAWRRYFVVEGRSELRPEAPLTDLRDFVRDELGRIAPGVTMEQCRGSHVSHRLAGIRRRVLKAAASRGYRTGDIACFFHVSPQTVSRAKYGPDTL